MTASYYSARLDDGAAEPRLNISAVQVEIDRTLRLKDYATTKDLEKQKSELLTWAIIIQVASTGALAGLLSAAAGLIAALT